MTIRPISSTSPISFSWEEQPNLDLFEEIPVTKPDLPPEDPFKAHPLNIEGPFLTMPLHDDLDSNLFIDPSLVSFPSEEKSVFSLFEETLFKESVLPSEESFEDHSLKIEEPFHTMPDHADQRRVSLFFAKQNEEEAAQDVMVGRTILPR